jgi:hypothetical protein
LEQNLVFSIEIGILRNVTKCWIFLTALHNYINSPEMRDDYCKTSKLIVTHSRILHKRKVVAALSGVVALHALCCPGRMQKTVATQLIHSHQEQFSC